MNGTYSFNHQVNTESPKRKKNDFPSTHKYTNKITRFPNQKPNTKKNVKLVQKPEVNCGKAMLLETSSNLQKNSSKALKGKRFIQQQRNASFPKNLSGVFPN